MARVTAAYNVPEMVPVHAYGLFDQRAPAQQKRRNFLILHSPISPR